MAPMSNDNPSPQPNVGGTFDGSVDTDTPLQAAAREAGWALTTLVDISDWQRRDQLSDIIGRLAKALIDVDTASPPSQHVGWTKVTPDMPHELLKSINVDNQVLVYERGRYFNAWLIFDEYEGGWCWTDEADSEPSPSHIRPLSEVALATTEGSTP